ncbi:MAG: aspartate carbamoyltransferase [Acidimicrobiia bacterium]|nr:aspartate carbamoyltransferase [Acidimicrobiia bacterium]
MRRRTLFAAAGFGVATLAIIVGIGVHLLLRSGDDSATQLGNRQAVVEARGAHVMPFDQAQTTHVFANTADGGIETVTANAVNNTGQIALIRMHLAQEAQLFASGDFTDPAAIHGRNMPGLAALESGASQVTFTYADAPRGATITYRTTSTKLVDALHVWFDAQLSDHGRHAHGT